MPQQPVSKEQLDNGTGGDQVVALDSSAEFESGLKFRKKDPLDTFIFNSGPYSTFTFSGLSFSELNPIARLEMQWAGTGSNDELWINLNGFSSSALYDSVEATQTGATIASAHSGTTARPRRIAMGPNSSTFVKVVVCVLRQTSLNNHVVVYADSISTSTTPGSIFWYQSRIYFNNNISNLTSIGIDCVNAAGSPIAGILNNGSTGNAKIYDDG